MQPKNQIFGYQPLKFWPGWKFWVTTRTGLNYLGWNWVEFGKSKILMHWAFLSHNFNRVENFVFQPIRIVSLLFSTRLRFLDFNPKGCNRFYSTRNNPNPVEVHNTRPAHERALKIGSKNAPLMSVWRSWARSWADIFFDNLSSLFFLNNIMTKMYNI